MHLRLPFSTQFTGVPTGFTGTRTIMLRRMMIGLVGTGRSAGGLHSFDGVPTGVDAAGIIRLRIKNEQTATLLPDHLPLGLTSKGELIETPLNLEDRKSVVTGKGESFR